MSWLKRNLYFALGSLVALGLILAGGYYLYTQTAAEGELKQKIDAEYEDLKKLIALNPHPGYGQIDNIHAAKVETAAIKAYITNTAPYFQRIPAIPDQGTNHITDADFASALRVTIDDLHHSAEQQSVIVPKDYYFTFESQKKIMIFDAASLPKVAVQLGEIKSICDILFGAKINSLDYIRREAVSVDDKNPSDYLALKSASTPMAELSPYEVKFRCFSTELAQVLSSFASSPNGFLVKSVNIEPTSAATEENPLGGPVIPATGQPIRRGGVTPIPNQPVRPVNTGRPQAFLTEKPFAVTLRVDVIKLKTLPAK